MTRRGVRSGARGAIRLLLPCVLLAGSGCATLQEVAALRRVDFSLDRISTVRLAGVDLNRVQRYEDLGLVDAARIASAVASRTMPLELTVHVRADNPGENSQARMTALDWTLFLQDRETVSGGLPAAVVIPAGGSTDIPLGIRLDLLEFFDGNGRDLVNLALSLAGQEAPPTSVRLSAIPTIDTPIGPIRYPEPITIARGSTGR